MLNPQVGTSSGAVGGLAGKEEVLVLPDEQLCRRFLCVGQVQQVYFFLCTAVQTVQRPKLDWKCSNRPWRWEKGQGQAQLSVTRHPNRWHKPKLLISFRSLCSYYTCTIWVAILSNSSSLTRRWVPLISSRPEDLSLLPQFLRHFDKYWVSSCRERDRICKVLII